MWRLIELEFSPDTSDLGTGLTLAQDWHWHSPMHLNEAEITVVLNINMQNKEHLQSVKSSED